MTKKQKTLASLRAAAFAAFNAHEQDMKTDSVYRKVEKTQRAKAEKRTIRKFSK